MRIVAVHRKEVTITGFCEPVTIRNDFELIVVDTEVESQRCAEAVFCIYHQSGLRPRSERTGKFNNRQNAFSGFFGSLTTLFRESNNECTICISPSEGICALYIRDEFDVITSVDQIEVVYMRIVAVHRKEVTITGFCEPVTIRNDFELIVVDTEVESQRCAEAVFCIYHQSGLRPRSERTGKFNNRQNAFSGFFGSLTRIYITGLGSNSVHCVITRVKGDLDGVNTSLFDEQLIVLLRIASRPSVILTNLELDGTCSKCLLGFLPRVETFHKRHVVCLQRRRPSGTKQGGIVTCYGIGVSRSFARLSATTCITGLGSNSVNSVTFRIVGDLDGVNTSLSDVQLIVLSRIASRPSVIFTNLELDGTCSKCLLGFLPRVETFHKRHVVCLQRRRPSGTEEGSVATCYGIGVSRSFARIVTTL